MQVPYGCRSCGRGLCNITRPVGQHPELHAKELAEMQRLVNLHSDGAADVVGRSAIRCMWCSAVVAVPPYRPHSFFFRGNAEEPEGAPSSPRPASGFSAGPSPFSFCDTLE